MDALREPTDPLNASPARETTAAATIHTTPTNDQTAEIKVEITPPSEIITTTSTSTPSDHLSSSQILPSSFSLDSNATTSAAQCFYLSERKASSVASSPHVRKMSEITSLVDTVLANPGSSTAAAGGAAGAAANSATKLYKKIEQLMDLSSPYNHYRCLSPSESNLTQCIDKKFMYSRPSIVGDIDYQAAASVGGSSRLLRRQFSLDRDDNSNQSAATAATYKTALNLDIPMLIHCDQRISSKAAGRLHKQSSTSVTLDLKKIEEIPVAARLSTIVSSPPPPPTGEESRLDKNEISLNVESLMRR